MSVRLAIYLGRAQAIADSHALRYRIRIYPNHDLTIEKHPHTGRVLRTVRLAFAVNVLGRWVWQPATEAMLDGFEANERTNSSRPRTRRAGTYRFWTSEGERWLRAGSPVNLLRCEE